MVPKDFRLFCRKITNDLATNLKYGEFVDAYVVLVDKIYNNPQIFNEITDNIINDTIFKQELARAFMSCIYTKEAKEVINKLKNSNETGLDLKEFLEMELEKYIQMDVHKITRVSRKRLKTMLKRIEKYYNYTTAITEKQKANAPNITWQEGLDAINSNIRYTRMRAQNAQRIALGMPEIDIQKYQDLQEREFLNEYKKFHSDDAQIEDRLQMIAINPRKIQMYVPKKEKFFDELVSINRIKRVPIYILDKMGILDIIRQRKLERELKEEVFIQEVAKKQRKIEPKLSKEEERPRRKTVQIDDEQT